MATPNGIGAEWDEKNLPRHALADAARARDVRNGRFDFDDLQLRQAPGAAAFDQDPALLDREAVLDEFLAHPFSQLLRLLIDAGVRDVGWVASLDMASEVRARRQASMIGPYLAYAWSNYISFAPWYKRFGEDTEKKAMFWARFGFAKPPVQSLVDQRFKELEAQWGVVAAVVRMLIANAVSYVPWLGDVVYGDGRAGVSRAEMEHCCEAFPGHECAKPTAETMRSDDAEDVNDARTKANRKLGDDEEDLETNRRHRESLRRPDGTLVTYRYFLIDGCWWRSLDLSAGFRKYEHFKWFGFIVYFLTGAIPGLPLDVVVAPADVQEYDLNPDGFAGLEASLGRSPLAAGYDSYCSTRPVATFHTLHRRALVAPRRGGHDPARRARWGTDKWDEDGIPRCPNCRGEGVVVGASIISQEPFLRFECRLQPLPGCKGMHMISCLEDAIALLPLTRLTEPYESIRYMRNNSENTHQVQARRHEFASKDSAHALGRLQSVPAQRLRIWACLLLDWYRASLRNGWLEAEQLAVVRHRIEPVILSGHIDPITHEVLKSGKGTPDLQDRLAAREAAGLYRPSGPAWDWFLGDLQRLREQGVAAPW